MPAPFSPNPADRPPDPSDAKAPSTQTSTEPTHDPEALTPLAAPVAAFEPPTVISAARARPTSFDPALGGGLAGRKLGHFELIESVGAGGMAAVLKARDLDLGRVVALKILPPDLAAEPENIVRFKQEARAAARLDHDNVARVYFFGEDQGLHFIAFEFVEGDNLRQLMTANGGSIPVPEAVSLMLQVAVGLGHAAERGVVHRDIKPSNIIVTPDGRAKIVDMGLARNLDPRAVGQLTESGVTLGTFDYISPEQALDPRSADVRSDIYSLGCTFYHALTGRPPVPEGSAAKKLDAQKNLLAPDPRGYNPAIPEDLVTILGKMMAKEPDRRYQDPAHLAAHLRTVARRLGVPVGPLPAHGPAFAEPIQRQPRLSAAWVLTAAAVLALFAVVITNAFRGPALDRPDAKGGPGPGGDPGPVPVAAGPREAANTDQLVALLDEGVAHIRLTGSEYDLVKWRYPNGQPADSLLTGDDVRLEADTPDGVPPVVRVGFSAFGLDGKARSKTLTLRGPGAGRGAVFVRGVRFVFPDRDGDANEAGLVVAGFERVAFEDCVFTPPGRPDAPARPAAPPLPLFGRDDRPPGNGAAAVAVVLTGGAASFHRCYFAPGSGGVSADGPGRVSATECAFGPQRAALRVLRSPGDQKGLTDVTLTHCSALLPTGGAVVEVGDLVPCAIKAAYCLFAGPQGTATAELPVVLRQRGDRAAETKYEADPKAAPNGYYAVAAYAEADMTWTFAEAAQEDLPVRDAERKLRYPWEDRDPFAWLPADARRAFRPNTKLADLRAGADQGKVLGTRFLGPDPLYDLALPSTDPEPRDPTVKVFDPSLPEAAEDKDLPRGVYPTLARALAALGRSGTVLIRHTGVLEVDPVEFTRPHTNIVIKPDVDAKPVLVPAAGALKKSDGLFKLYAKDATGRLVLDGLQFRLPSGRVPAVVVLPGGGNVEIRNSVITLEEGEDVAAVVLTEPRGAMMMGTAGPATWPLPKVTVENVFVRGKGRLLAVKQSRPFELEVKNSLAALDGNLIDIDPAAIDVAMAAGGQVRLTRLTAYLGGSLLQVRGAERKTETTPLGLTRTEVTATQCVFAPAGTPTDPLVRTDRLDGPEQVATWLGWAGKDNVYGYDRKGVVLEMRTGDAMPPRSVDGAGWLGLAKEEGGDPFATVRFPGEELPPAGQAKKFLAAKPADFHTPRTDPPRPDGSPEVGAGEVPVPVAEE